jgi:5'-nucleotidase/UDP-sugar diphosphatase
VGHDPAIAIQKEAWPVIIRPGAALVALFLSAAVVQADRLHILHVNDLHSRIEPITKYDSTCAPEDDAAGECFGGVARLAAKVAALRADLEAAGERVILLDAGDQFQGSLMYTTYKGAAEAEFMEAMGFDAMAVGNHEFDDGPEGLAGFLDKVSFPVISGNIDVSGSGVLAGRVGNHVVLDLDGMKVGIVSALAVDTVETSSPGDDVVFADEAEALRADVATLTAQGVEKIIALTHVGLSRDLDLAAEVPGIDAIVGGHSHTLMSNGAAGALPYPQMVGGVPVVQAFAYGKYLGHLVLEFDAAGTVTAASGDTILLDASVTPDAAMAARVAELAGPIAEVKARVVAEAAADIDGGRETCRIGECTMGNLVADAMLARVRDQGVSIAIQNGGGLRASIAAGQVTMGDVLGVLPFQNTLSTFEATGATVLAALENGLSQIDEGAGRFPQVAGMRYVFDPAADAGARVVSAEVREGDGWVTLDPGRTYGVVTNNYMRGGGDGYAMFETEGMNAYDFGPDLADVLADYMAANAPYQPGLDGRITMK